MMQGVARIVGTETGDRASVGVGQYPPEICGYYSHGQRKYPLTFAPSSHEHAVALSHIPSSALSTNQSVRR